MPLRFKVIFLTILAVFICYIDRVNISITIIPMAQELGWDYERIGLVSASFFVGYIITQILGGYLSDKFGAKQKRFFAISLKFSYLFSIKETKQHEFNIFFSSINFLLGENEYDKAPSYHLI